MSGPPLPDPPEDRLSVSTSHPTATFSGEVPPRTRPSVEMATIIHKLKWAKEWSVLVSPEEAVILSRLIDDYFSRLNA